MLSHNKPHIYEADVRIGEASLNITPPGSEVGPHRPQQVTCGLPIAACTLYLGIVLALLGIRTFHSAGVFLKTEGELKAGVRADFRSDGLEYNL